MIRPGEGRTERSVRDFAPFLAEASEVLASSLDYEATLSSVADLVVSGLADWCAIDMLDEDGSIQQLAVTHKDSEKGDWARELRRRYPSDPDAERGVPRVLRDGEPEFYREVTDEMLVAAARDGEHLRVLREVGFTSVMILPLVARGRTLGAIMLVLAESGRRYEDGDLALAEDLARRAALAVDNACLHEEAKRGTAERERAREQLHKQAAILRAVAFSAQRFLRGGTTLDESLGEVLERLGKAASVSRVYVFENYTGRDGERWATRTHEWVAPGITSQIDNPLLKALPYKETGFGRWEGIFGRGETLYGSIRDLPARERPEFETEGTLSIVLVPIFVEDDWWGFIGFDECESEREWSAAEIDALKAAASTLGAALERKRGEDNLIEKEEQYRGVFESTGDGLVIRTLEGAIVDANPAFCRMHGYSLEELRSLEPAALVHPDDRDRFQRNQGTIKEGGRSRYRRKDVRQDGSVLHVEVHGEIFLYRSRPHLLNVVRDVTERVESYRLLEKRVEQRTRELRVLLEVSNKVASTLELKPLLGLILDQLATVIDYADSSLLVFEGDELETVAYRGPIPEEQVIGTRFSPERGRLIWEEFETLESIILDDVRGDVPLARAYRQVVGEERLRKEFSHIRSWMGVPLVLGDRAIGMLAIIHDEPDHYTARHAELARTIANQAAIAIENAHLYEQAQSVAALEERQRLARELHDSVSQALYGIALGARTARTWLDRDASRVAAPLDYVLSLSEAGMAEMRALIFELRPGSLESEGLVVALEKQAAALRARHGIEVRAALCEEPDIPSEVKETFYRIAQEALHNAVKHARATVIQLRLEADAGAIELKVSDDGVGFDPSDSFPGHLGLLSMRERAERTGGTLEVESALGRGTLIHIRVPA